MRADLLDLLGIGYLTDAIAAAMDAERREEDYRCYIADLLKVIAECCGASVNRHYYDIRHPQPEDPRTAEEIGEDFMRRHGLRFADQPTAPR